MPPLQVILQFVVCATTLSTLLGLLEVDGYLAGFVGPILVCFMLPVPMTVSDLHYESDGSHSVASLDLRQPCLGANSSQSLSQMVALSLAASG